MSNPPFHVHRRVRRRGPVDNSVRTRTTQLESYSLLPRRSAYLPMFCQQERYVNARHFFHARLAYLLADSFDSINMMERVCHECVI